MNSAFVTRPACAFAPADALSAPAAKAHVLWRNTMSANTGSDIPALRPGIVASAGWGLATMPQARPTGMRRLLLAAVLLGLAPVSVSAGSLTLFASGEDLATEGFNAPELTRDGWALEFTSITAHFDHITAWQTDPPFMADSAHILGIALPLGGPLTADLANADADNRVALSAVGAPPGHYNALSWALVPGDDGFSLVLDGIARKDGQEVAFTLRTSDRVMHACGEYLGDARKGFLADGGEADLEITLHLDHLFGRADKAQDDAMNLGAPGFAPFAAGGVHDISLSGLHLGHVGEGHCHVAPF